MSGLRGLPSTEAMPHGTRGRYVRGCRCDACRRSNTIAAHERVLAVRAAAAEVRPNKGPAETKTFRRIRPDGSRYEVRVRACPGTGGKPCVAGGAWLRGGRAVCLPCVDRARVWSGLVPAARARRHLRKLSRAGVGYKSVADAGNIGTCVLQDILSGAATRIRASTERRILAIDVGARADHSLVPSAPTWALLGDLAARGFTRSWISTELGYAHNASWFSHRPGGRRELMIARNAADVERLHRRVVEQGLTPPSPFVDAGPTYRIINQLLERVRVKPLKKILGYNFTRVSPSRVRVATAERVQRFHAELERRRIEGDPLPEGWQWGGGTSPVTSAFGYEGGWHWEQRTSKKAKAREELELQALAGKVGRG